MRATASCRIWRQKHFGNPNSTERFFWKQSYRSKQMPLGGDGGRVGIGLNLAMVRWAALEYHDEAIPA